MSALAERVGTQPPEHYRFQWQQPSFDPHKMDEPPAPPPPMPFNPSLDDEEREVDTDENESSGFQPDGSPDYVPMATVKMEEDCQEVQPKGVRVVDDSGISSPDIPTHPPEEQTAPV